MTLQTLALGAMIILGLNLWAIICVIGSPRSMAAKAAWIAGIIVFPILGFLSWAMIGPRPRRDRH